jgi:pyruvate dehydrogenase E2 component (dihydrolipoamide acetyltransferase)
VFDQINIAVAIALDDGLLAPALLDCRDLDVLTIAGRLRSLVERANSGRLKPQEMNEPTFTISNLGMFGVRSFAAILNPPQVAILATGSATPRPVIEDGVIMTRTTMTMTLSADHRALDGAMAAAFLGSVREILQTYQLPVTGAGS